MYVPPQVVCTNCTPPPPPPPPPHTHPSTWSFHGGCRHPSVIAVIFKIYDVDHDGYVSESDLFHVMKLMCGGNLTDDQLQTIVRSTL